MEENENQTEIKSCCERKDNDVDDNKKKTLLQGIIYGLIPHAGCIAFILFSILGVTSMTAFFKPLLMNRYFFYILIGISLLFATFSSYLYLRKTNLLSFAGMIVKWKYLLTMYSSTVGVNLILFMLIFPMLANVSASPTGAVTNIDKLSSLTLKVDIPCPGHAPLISEELKNIAGVREVKFSFPDVFDVKYDATTDEDEILALGIFDTYSAVKLNENIVSIAEQTTKGCGSCSSCNGACGGSCEIKV